MTYRMQALGGFAALCLVAGAATAASAQTSVGASATGAANATTQQLNQGQLQHPGKVPGASGANDMSAPAANAQKTRNGPMGQAATSNMAKSSPFSAQNQTAASVSKPKSTLASAKVEDSSGATIGTVSHVTTDAKGQARAIDISLKNSGKKVRIDATKLHYQPTTHALKMNMTEQQLDQMNGSADTTTQTP